MGITVVNWSTGQVTQSTKRKRAPGGFNTKLQERKESGTEEHPDAPRCGPRLHYQIHGRHPAAQV